MSSLVNLLKTIRGNLYRYHIQVMDNDTTLTHVLRDHLSVIRFGDGEFNVIAGHNIPYQKYEGELAHEMEMIIMNGSSDSIMVCLPDVFTKMGRYNRQCRIFYYESFFYQNRRLLNRIQSAHRVYGSTFLSRPYIDMKDKSNAATYFSKLKTLWTNRDILIVEGKYTRSGENNDLFANANSVKRIIAPSHDAFDKHQIIEKAIIKYAGDRLILLMLGPTSKVIAYNLKSKQHLPNQIIDIGHIDSEYEWFRMGATKKVKIAHKHTAEFNNDDNKVTLLNDPEYKKQIVEIIDY